MKNALNLKVAGTFILFLAILYSISSCKNECKPPITVDLEITSNGQEDHLQYSWPIVKSADAYQFKFYIGNQVYLEKTISENEYAFSLPYSLTRDGKRYFAEVISICPKGDSAPTTEPCPDPENLDFGPYDGEQMTFNWSSVTNASSYLFSFSVNDSIYFAGTPTPDTFFTVVDLLLTPGDTISATVQSVCDTNQVSQGTTVYSVYCNGVATVEIDILFASPSTTNFCESTEIASCPYVRLRDGAGFSVPEEHTESIFDRTLLCTCLLNEVHVGPPTKTVEDCLAQSRSIYCSSFYDCEGE